MLNRKTVDINSDSAARDENGTVPIVSTLQKKADTLIAEAQYEAALSMLSTALMFAPGHVGMIHRVGKCLELIGEEKAAASCYRGVLPDIVNDQHFNAKVLKERIKPAAECKDVSYLAAFDKECLALAAPKRNNTEKPYNQFNYKTTEARETFCTVANSGAVWFDGYNTVALDCKNNVISEQIKGNEFSSYHASKIHQSHRLKGTACLLDGRSSKIYYHWMLDILPKLGVVEKAGIDLSGIDYFIVSATSRFQRDTLLACGIDTDRIVFSSSTSLYSADTMIVPCLRNDLGDRIYHGLGVGLASWIPLFLQQKFRTTENGLNDVTSVSDELKQSPQSEKSLRVYISRSTRGSRNIANEPAMIEALEERGFQRVEFENLTVPEQADLMGQAEVVVAVHGAGFTNLSFCNPGTRVIEIFGDYVVPCYWALCAVAGLDYAQYMATSVDTGITSSNPGERVSQLRDMEIAIDVDDFINYLDSTLDTCDA